MSELIVVDGHATGRRLTCRRIMRLLFLAICFMPIACTFDSETRLADGRTGHKLSCGGALNTMESCMSRARELCPSGFDVVSENSRSSPVLMQAGGRVFFPANVQWRNATVVCTDGQKPASVFEE